MDDSRVPPELLDTAVERAAEICRLEDERTLAWQTDLTRIPAPPFAEEARAARMEALLADAGASRVRMDELGNVLGEVAGPGGVAPLVLSAHLDTVFAADVAIAVTREGDVLRGPGISDDGRGLAVVLAVVRALTDAGVRLGRPVLIAATVGEEGLGDLRGARHLVGPRGDGRSAAGFISVDGAGLDRIVSRGVGSRRFRLSASGTGGHSWQDWGIANPIHALAAAAHRVTSAIPPSEPKTTLTVARWGGGTSINAIPQEAWIEVDMRSTSEEELDRLEWLLRTQSERAVVDESVRGTGSALNVALARVGSRVAGVTPSDHPLVRALIRATEAVGVTPLLTESSTDANAAMAAGIPAVTVGGGGEGGFSHTTHEWYRNTRGSDGVLRALYAVALFCDVE